MPARLLGCRHEQQHLPRPGRQRFGAPQVRALDAGRQREVGLERPAALGLVAGQLDQGLAFVSFQRSLADGFLAVQGRLNGEPLEEYIRGEGGGFFFALPGAQPGGHLGDGLLA